MIKFMKRSFLFLISIFLLSGLYACGNEKYLVTTIPLENAFRVENMVKIFHKQKYEMNYLVKLQEELNATLNELDNKFNVQDRGDGIVTDLMKINNNSGIKPVEVDQEVIDVIKIAIEMSEETKVNDVALFDVTIAPVWDLWDFPNKGFNEMDNNYFSPPKNEIIQTKLELVDYRLIKIDEDKNTVFLEKAGMKIDLGAIVKGYAADKLRDVLISHNIEKAIIDVGRNILALGNFYNPDTLEDADWSILIITPNISAFDPDYKNVSWLGELKYGEATFVTSGTYERYIKDYDEKEYHHILDPRTGYPFDNKVVSITIITDKSIMGDALSTSLFSLGLEKGMEYVNANSGIETIWVIKENENYEVYISSGLENNFVMNEKLNERNFVYKGVYK